MSQKIHIMTFVAYYLPGYKSGGPLRTIFSMVDSCGDVLGFHLITKDRDLGDKEAYPSVTVDEWVQVGKACVYYASPKTQSFSGLYRVMSSSSFDAVYLNSFFHPVFSLGPLVLNSLFFRKPLVLCPRGEFSPGALAIKSFRKQLFIRAFKLLGWHRHVLWQATDCTEADFIRTVFGGAVNVKNAQDISLPKLSDGIFPRKKLPLKVVFLSRISKIKNLIGVLRSLSRVRSPVSLDIYGPASRPEDIAYMKQCQNLAETLPAHISVRFCGEVVHDAVSQTLSGYDLFFLPTFGENFGHAILEALAAGLPILIGNTTPWRNLKEAGVGWDIDPYDHSAFADSIDSVARLSPEDHLLMRKKALAYASEYIENSEAVEQTKALFQLALNSSKQK